MPACCGQEWLMFGNNILNDLPKETLTIEFIRWDETVILTAPDFSRGDPDFSRGELEFINHSLKCLPGGKQWWLTFEEDAGKFSR
jgi:hypothetical protein